MTETLFDKVAIVGLGLIGSSMARGIKKHGLSTTVIGFDGSPDVRARSRELGFCDAIAESAEEAVANARLVVLAVPVGAMEAAAQSVAPHLAEGAIVTDVGSVKAAVVRQVGPVLPDHAVFVPGHPVAGTEYSGPEAGFAELFEGRWYVLTPCERSTAAGIEAVEALWRGLGSTIEQMTPEHHDIVLAMTSHVPHLIAYNIVGTAAELETVTQSEVIKFSAGGFRDFTRIASSDPVMWRDVFLSNKDAVLEVLGRFSEDLAALQRLIRWDDGQALQDRFTRSRAIRHSIIDAGQDTADADFGRPHGHDD
ncbi:MAG: prephenate/arogenate dehydrogenase family protein [Methyloceanibacter sp.]|nr:prephenate/arogenate dehydrogenase family protein [Methyloceanibacter sp.]